jgi:hypothetical protein
MADFSVATRSKTNIFLIGSTVNCINGAKLPSNLQVLQLFFHYHSNLKHTVKESCNLTYETVVNFWEKGGIPTRAKQHVIAKLESKYQQWRNIQRNCKRRSETQMQKEETFVKDFSLLFDIAHQDAIHMIKIQEDRDFLTSQRDGMQGCMTSIDMKKLKSDERKQQREKKFEERRTRAEKQKWKIEETVTLELSSDENTSETECNFDDVKIITNKHTFQAALKVKRARKGIKDIVSPQVASTLDRCKISDRKAVHILAATAASLGQDVSELNISRSTIKRARQENRFARARKIKDEFNVDVSLTIHWDGKLLTELTGSEKVDRLAILVSGGGVQQLLAVPKLENGTGKAIAEAIYESINDWGIKEQVCGMCFDTTAVNTGDKSGACVLLEQMLGKRMLSFACRHHALEVVLESVFSKALGASSTGPDILLFKRFKKQWNLLDKTKFRTITDDEYISSKISDEQQQQVLSFARKNIDESQPRDDYRELLHLTIIFLSGRSSGNVSFRAPAGLHRARWMARVLYAYKILMFGTTSKDSNSFQISAAEEKGLQALLCFVIVGGYIEAWITAPLAISAAMNDLKFLSRLQAYSAIDKVIADTAMHKFLRHLWYLSDEMIGLAFFDETIPVDEKMAMVLALHEVRVTSPPPKRVIMNVSDIRHGLKPSSLVTDNTNKFFSAMRLSMDFLTQNPASWPDDSNYISSRNIVSKVKVVNDTAERGVALIQEFTDLITHDEQQKQFLLQIVAEHRKLLPGCSKSAMVEAFK